MIQFDKFQGIGRDGVEATMKSISAISKGAQAVMAETADFAKRSYEQSTTTFESLTGARTLDRAMTIQGDYLRTSYQDFLAQATKMGELCTSTAKEAAAPIEGLVSRSATAV